MSKVAKLDIPAVNPPESVSMLSPISRVTQLSDGSVVLHDIVVTSETPDSQGEIIDYDSFKAVAPEFMKWATVGEMHDPGRWDAGTVLKLKLDDATKTASADLHVVDPVAVQKVLAKVYKAVSVHGEWGRRIAEKGLHRIFLRFIDEISLVPRGANPDATFAKRYVLAKMDVDKAELSGAETNDLPDSDFAYIEPGGAKDESGRTVPRSLRHFPINDEAHVRNALSRLPQSPFEAKARPAVEAAARRMNIGEQKEDSTMAKAAEAAPAAEPLLEGYVPSADVTAVSPTGEVLEVKGVPVGTGVPSPGVAKADEGPGSRRLKTIKVAKCTDGKCGKCSKCMKTAAKVAKANSPLAVAKAAAKSARELERAQKVISKAKTPKVAKAKGLKAGLKAQQAIGDAMEAKHKDQADGEDAGDKLDALSEADDALHEFNSAESSDVAKKIALRLVKSQRVAKAKVAKARKVAKSRKRTIAKMRRGSGVSKVFRVLAKAGARHSASDLETIRGIHKATVSLGYDGCVEKVDSPVHDVAVPAPTIPTLPEPPGAVAKADNAFDFETALREAIPQIGAEAVTQMKAALAEQYEELGRRVAKIESRGASGGPAAAVGYFDPGTGNWVPAEGRSGPVSKADALAAAAAVTDSPSVRQQLGQEAGLDMLKTDRPWRR